MTVQYSTGLSAHLAVTGSKKTALDNGFLYYFSGPVPATADAAIDGSSVMLAKFTANADGATGLTFEATAAGGVLTKTAAQVWKSTVAATGTATFFRFADSTDAGASTLSTTAKRIQGTLGTTAASDAQITSTALTAAASITVDMFQDY
jgi:hypothetical protein